MERFFKNRSLRSITLAGGLICAIVPSRTSTAQVNSSSGSGRTRRGHRSDGLKLASSSAMRRPVGTVSKFSSPPADRPTRRGIPPH